MDANKSTRAIIADDEKIADAVARSLRSDGEIAVILSCGMVLRPTKAKAARFRMLGWARNDRHRCG